MSYQEDGETLEGLSSFTGAGFAPLPPLYHDSERIHNVVAWPAHMLTSRIIEYNDFLHQTPPPMPRARKTAEWLLTHMLYEETSRIHDGINEGVEQ